MRLFPYKEFQIKTIKSKTEVVNILTEVTVFKGDFRLLHKNKHFNGSVNSNGFELIPRGIWYGKRSFRPIISGSIEEENNRTIVKGSFRVSIYERLMVFLISGSFFLLVLIDIESMWVFMIFSVIAFLINLGSIYLFFNSHVNHCLRLIEDFVEARNYIKMH